MSHGAKSTHVATVSSLITLQQAYDAVLWNARVMQLEAPFFERPFDDFMS